MTVGCAAVQLRTLLTPQSVRLLSNGPTGGHNYCRVKLLRLYEFSHLHDVVFAD
jgi:hypothetical protein